jgi:ABC-type multidrug transport system fused ATPase/permease subunit
VTEKFALARLRDPPPAVSLRHYFGVFQYGARALSLVWRTHRTIAAALLALSVAAGLLPALITYTGKLIVDAVVQAAGHGRAAPAGPALTYLELELMFVLALAAVQRALSVCESLLRALLAQSVNELILEKALTLSLADFEDSEFYDRMSRARREASSRPLSLVRRVFGLLQNSLSLVVYGGLLLHFSFWTVVVLALSALPAFVSETRFSADAFRLFRWRAPETRMQSYLETLLAREDHAKEVTLFGLGPLFLSRYREIFDKLFAEDRSLTLRRGLWGFGLGLLSSCAFYGAYAFIVMRAVQGTISLGDMTMYLLVFKQGQSALSAMLAAIGGMYEDNLYLSNLYEYLEHPSRVVSGSAVQGPDPSDGIRFEHVSFAYPGAASKALDDVSLHIPRGQKLAVVGENGAGKTTLIKLLTRLYEPSEGRLLLDGLPLREWDANALRARVGVIFQDFIRYQLLLGENIGAGDVTRFDDEARWRTAGSKGMVDSFVERLTQGYRTQLGRWFQGGQELSIGQWQKVALARAFMREHADILVLDEPTAAMDAEAEAEIFQRFRGLSENRMGIVISHRFSTVRMADQIVVLQGGRVVEQGSHAELMHKNGRYALLFNLQAEGYR